MAEHKRYEAQHKRYMANIDRLFRRIARERVALRKELRMCGAQQRKTERSLQRFIRRRQQPCVRTS
jgi:hypothetical protein